MAWKYNGAQFTGDKAHPRSGDQVVIRFRDPSINENRTLSFTINGLPANWPQFVAQVKINIREHLQHLNNSNVEDVTGDFEP